ncbi:S8 family serine peptidase [Paraburkholderia sp. NPDC080076]|uniref:S8 family serine peptidase n=1 Tax=Paraburkholderia sp. NPDC080076 TaxID=3390605 RepID=UPI003CFC37A2
MQPKGSQGDSGAASYLPDNTIVVRIGQAPSIEHIAALAKIGAIQTISIPHNTRPESVLRRFCGGSFTGAYLKQVLSANPAFRLDAEPWERKVQVTPCPRFKARPSERIADGDTLNTILVRAMGVDRDQPINNCAATSGASACLVEAGVATAMLNGGSRLLLAGELPAGRTVTTPARTEWMTVPLKPGITPVQAQLFLQSASIKGAPFTTAFTPDLKLIRPLSRSDPALKGSSCDSAARLTKPWPFDQAALQHALERAISIAQRRRVLTRSVVRIADTGATGLETFFPSEALMVHPDVEAGSVDEQGMGHYGYAVDGGTTVEPLNDDPNRLHGTEVADLALGGYEFRQNYKDVYKVIGIDFVNVFRPVPSHLVEADTTALVSSFFMVPPRAEIINVSLGGTRSNPVFETMLASYANSNVLTVVAAGNDNVDLNEHRLYPAWNGGAGQFENKMIVVGAAQPDGTRAPFSNYGEGRVDILAPGCRLQLNTPEGRFDDVGTSFAAPAVTFAIGMTHGLGVESLLDAKKHVIASADYSPAIEGKDTILGARLNIVRAVESIYDDVITDKDGNDLPGKWQRVDSIRFCRGQEKMNTRTILRVDALNGPDSKVMLRVLRDDGEHGIGKPIICEQGEGITVQLLDPGTGRLGEPKTFSWNTIGAFVPARFVVQ